MKTLSFSGTNQEDCPPPSADGFRHLFEIILWLETWTAEIILEES